MKTRKLKIQDWILLALGIIFLAFTVIIVLKIPQPTEVQMWIFRIIASLGAACIGAFIPGLFEISSQSTKITFRATGAAAFFVLMYLFNPPDLVIQLLT